MRYAGKSPPHKPQGSFFFRDITVDGRILKWTLQKNVCEEVNWAQIGSLYSSLEGANQLGNKIFRCVIPVVCVCVYIYIYIYIYTEKICFFNP